jgi:hypothetical protein
MVTHAVALSTDFSSPSPACGIVRHAKCAVHVIR